jgi:hypothetical protein
MTRPVVGLVVPVRGDRGPSHTVARIRRRQQARDACYDAHEKLVAARAAVVEAAMAWNKRMVDTRFTVRECRAAEERLMFACAALAAIEKETP